MFRQDGHSAALIQEKWALMAFNLPSKPVERMSLLEFHCLRATHPGISINDLSLSCSPQIELVNGIGFA